MKVIVIGSKGFIGNKCEKFFITKGNDVWGCDVVNDYNSERYFQIDSTNSDYHRIFQNNEFDLCINCSGAASVPLSLKFPLKDYTLNTYNVYKILDAIRQFQPDCRFITLSSAAVYGNPESLPIIEKQSKNPVSPYGEHKLNAERICEQFKKFYNIQTCSLRIFSAYGEGLKKQLFWDLFKKARSQDEIELFGTGNESRDFIHVDDVIQSIFLLSSIDQFQHSNINIANGEEIFIKNAVDIFYKNFDDNINYKFKGEGRKGDPSNWVANISKIKSLGYKQTVTFEEGLKRYFLWANKE